MATSAGDHLPEACIAVPQAAGPQIAEPLTAGPLTAGPLTAGPLTTGPETAIPALEALRLLRQTRAELAEARDLLADSEQRAAAERELTLRLQRAIMPSGVRVMASAGVDVAVRCLPAKPGSLVTGDWYDALQLPGGDLLFVVGDIAGHGMEAMTGMVAARNALRGLAVTGAEPGELIGKLNYSTCLFAEGVTGTVICGRYSPREPDAPLGQGRAPAAGPRPRRDRRGAADAGRHAPRSAARQRVRAAFPASSPAGTR